MSPREWESLCDGCGQCCRVLLIDDDDDVYETSACCRLFDPAARRCTRYQERFALVPDCVKVTPANVGQLDFMPESCAYRRLHEGRGLASWHPLVSGRRESVAEAGVAVEPSLTNELRVDPDDLWDLVIGQRPKKLR